MLLIRSPNTLCRDSISALSPVIRWVCLSNVIITIPRVHLGHPFNPTSPFISHCHLSTLSAPNIDIIILSAYSDFHSIHSSTSSACGHYGQRGWWGMLQCHRWCCRRCGTTQVLLDLIRCGCGVQVQVDLVLIHRRVQLGIQDHCGRGRILSRNGGHHVRSTTGILKGIVVGGPTVVVTQLGIRCIAIGSSIGQWRWQGIQCV